MNRATTRPRTARLLALALAAPLLVGAPVVAPVAVASAAEQSDQRTLGQRALDEAPKHAGKPYRYGAAGPDSFDCSGFTSFVFRAAGKEIPRTSADQYAASQKIDKAQAQPGDLIAVFTDGRVTHVGIYAGDMLMWDASRSGGEVSKRKIWTSSFKVGRFS